MVSDLAPRLSLADSLTDFIAGVDWSTTGAGLSVGASVTIDAVVVVIDVHSIRFGSEFLAESCEDTNVSLGIELAMGVGVVSLKLAPDVELGCSERLAASVELAISGDNEV